MPPAEYLRRRPGPGRWRGHDRATFGFPGDQADPRTVPPSQRSWASCASSRTCWMLGAGPAGGPGRPEYALLEGTALEGEATEGLRGEFVARHGAPKVSHVLTSGLSDEEITLKRLSRDEVVILPGELVGGRTDCGADRLHAPGRPPCCSIARQNKEARAFPPAPGADRVDRRSWHKWARPGQLRAEHGGGPGGSTGMGTTALTRPEPRIEVGESAECGCARQAPASRRPLKTRAPWECG